MMSFFHLLFCYVLLLPLSIGYVVTYKGNIPEVIFVGGCQHRPLATKGRRLGKRALELLKHMVTRPWATQADQCTTGDAVWQRGQHKKFPPRARRSTCLCTWSPRSTLRQRTFLG